MSPGKSISTTISFIQGQFSSCHWKVMENGRFSQKVQDFFVFM